jgi:hypothetical protein
MTRFPLVFIVGVGHSGSNLLSRMLERHPAITCVGETAFVDYALQQEVPCTCGAALADCPYWGPLLPLLAGRRGDYDHRRFRPELFAKLRERAGAEVLVDNSKTRAWRIARRWPNVGFLLLVRDSRGVMAAALRSGGELDHVLPRHRKWIRRVGKLPKKRPENTLVLRYEDLALEPERELRRVTAFLGLAFDAALLAENRKPYHFLYSKKTGALDKGSRVELDERWRSELAPADVERIERTMRRVRFYRGLYPAGSAEPVRPGVP